MSHEHLVLCCECGTTIIDERDCVCIGAPFGYSLCAYCREQRAYERQEAKRNDVYVGPND